MERIKKQWENEELMMIGRREAVAVFGTVFSVVLLQEEVTSRMILGSITILLAVLISELSIKKKEKISVEAR